MRILKKWLSLLLMCFLPGLAMAATTSVPAVYTEDKPVATILPDQPVFSIKLKSNPTTGFLWYLRSYDANVLEPVKHTFEPAANKKLIGAPGYEIWTFRVKPNGFVVPMQTFIRFVYGRSWETNSQANQFVFQVTTRGKDK